MLCALARRSRRSALTTGLLSFACLAVIAGCGGGSSSRKHSASAAKSSSETHAASATESSSETGTGSTTATSLLAWQLFAHVHGVLDLTSPLPGTATIRVAANGRLETLSGRQLRPFSPDYSAPPGLETYIAESSGQRVADAGCSFPREALYALRLTHGNGVTVVDQHGHVRRFAALPSRGLEDGITFDLGGRFGHRLLVTTYIKKAGASTVAAISCRGQVTVVTRHAPRLEGGIVVAPSSFGRYGGDLIVPDELTGNVYAISPSGHVTLVANSGLAHGQDVDTESVGFVPARYGAALVSDRGTPHNHHPGDNEILALPQAALQSGGVTTGDLLVVDEGGAGTIAVTCSSTCRVRHVANAPATAHIERHVVFSRR
jgi:hypothetical protein